MSVQQEVPQVGENYFRHRLSNGLQVVGQLMPSLSSAAFGIMVPAGAEHEPEGKGGVSHLLEYVAFQGTENRTARELTEELERLGARHGSEATAEYSRYSAQIVGKRLHETMDVIADVMLHPSFPEDELEQMRSVILQEIRRREDEPMRRVFDLLRTTFYIGSKLAHPVLGTHESVSALTRDDLRAYWQDRYRPEGAVLSVAGNFDWEDTIGYAEKLFSQWTGAPGPVEIGTPQPSSTVVLIPNEGQQEHIGISYPFITYGDPDYFAAALLSEIFGGGMTSRLFSEVREKRGLVYSVSSGFSPNATLGSVFIYGGTTPEKANQTLAVIVDELHRLEQDGVTEDELRRAKVQLKSELVMRSESSGSRMLSMIRSWWYEKKIYTIQQIKSEIEAVTTKQILSLLQRKPSRQAFVVAAIGPLTKEELTAGVNL